MRPCNDESMLWFIASFWVYVWSTCCGCCFCWLLLLFGSCCGLLLPDGLVLDPMLWLIASAWITFVVVYCFLLVLFPNS